MKIMTSYFSSKAPKERKVSIAKWPPRGFKGHRASILAPSDPKAVDWEKAYRTDLENRFPNGTGLQGVLEEIAEKIPNPILCCFEKNKKECHRDILADYAKKHINLDIKEWEEPEQGTF